MSNITPVKELEELSQQIMKVVMTGDLYGLTEVQKFQYYTWMCKRVGLDAALSPFKYIELNRKLVLYADKGAGEQLRTKHMISLEPVSSEMREKEGLYVVVTRARLPDGRTDVGTGAVSIAGLKGVDLANAVMKCETKSKRRATLSICGLNMLDESEVDDIKAGRAPGISATSINREIPDEMAVEQGNNDPHEEPLFTRGTFAHKKRPSEVHVNALRRWVEMVEKRLADPHPKKPLTAEERCEWQWNVEIAAKRIAEVETAPIQDSASFDGLKS